MLNVIGLYCMISYPQKVNEHHTGLGRRASICEVVLGVVPGRFSEPPDSRVMVAGLVPTSQALNSGVIKIGKIDN